MLLKGIRLVLFLAELNALESLGEEIRSTYLREKTKEKVCIIDKLEFGPLKDHILMITKSVRDLRT